MIEVRYLRKMIDGQPVMARPPEIDVTTADQLRAVLVAATENRYRTLVVDMTRTRFCDSAAVHARIAAHKRVLAKGGELRLVVPADGAVHRVLTLLGIDHFIHCFASLEKAVAPASDGVGHPGNVGGHETWEDAGSWRHSGNTRMSCANAR